MEFRRSTGMSLSDLLMASTDKVVTPPPPPSRPTLPRPTVAQAASASITSLLSSSSKKNREGGRGRAEPARRRRPLEVVKQRKRKRAPTRIIPGNTLKPLKRLASATTRSHNLVSPKDITGLGTRRRRGASNGSGGAPRSVVPAGSFYGASRARSELQLTRSSLRSSRLSRRPSSASGVSGVSSVSKTKTKTKTKPLVLRKKPELARQSSVVDLTLLSSDEEDDPAQASSLTNKDMNSRVTEPLPIIGCCTLSDSYVYQGSLHFTRSSLVVTGNTPLQIAPESLEVFVGTSTCLPFMVIYPRKHKVPTYSPVEEVSISIGVSGSPFLVVLFNHRVRASLEAWMTGLPGWTRRTLRTIAAGEAKQFTANLDMSDLLATSKDMVPVPASPTSDPHGRRRSARLRRRGGAPIDITQNGERLFFFPSCRRTQRAPRAESGTDKAKQSHDEDTAHNSDTAAVDGAGNRPAEEKAANSAETSYGGEEGSGDITHEKGSVLITQGDYARLNSGELLNDSVIDCYLKWIQLNLLDDEARSQVYVYSTYFYPRLTEGKGNSAKARRLTGYNNVKSWTQGVDVFSKKYLFVPIHRTHHWSLAVIQNPGLLLPPRNGDVRSPHKKPKKKPPVSPDTCSIFFFDSLGIHPQASICVDLRQYLVHEALHRHNAKVCITTQNLPKHAPPAPKQRNAVDCGVFVLLFAENFITRWAFALSPRLMHRDITKRWFTARAPSRLRDKIRKLFDSWSASPQALLDASRPKRKPLADRVAPQKERITHTAQLERHAHRAALQAQDMAVESDDQGSLGDEVAASVRDSGSSESVNLETATATKTTHTRVANGEGGGGGGEKPSKVEGDGKSEELVGHDEDRTTSAAGHGNHGSGSGVTSARAGEGCKRDRGKEMEGERSTPTKKARKHTLSSPTPNKSLISSVITYVKKRWRNPALDNKNKLGRPALPEAPVPACKTISGMPAPAASHLGRASRQVTATYQRSLSRPRNKAMSGLTTQFAHRPRGREEKQVQHTTTGGSDTEREVDTNTQAIGPEPPRQSESAKWALQERVVPGSSSDSDSSDVSATLPSTLDMAISLSLSQ